MASISGSCEVSASLSLTSTGTTKNSVTVRASWSDYCYAVIEVTGMDGSYPRARKLEWSLSDGSSDVTEEPAGATNASCYFYGLSLNESYSVSVDIYGDVDGEWLYLTSLSGSVSAASIYSRTITIFCSNTSEWEDFEVSSASGSVSKTFYGLSSGTSYNFQAAIYYNGSGSAAAHVSKNYSTDEISFQWTWAGMIDGVPVRGTSKVAGYEIYITADEWNELVSSVNEKYGTNFSGVIKGAPIYAATVNEIAVALGVSTVTKGSPITAAFFNQLMAAF